MPRAEPKIERQQLVAVDPRILHMEEYERDSHEWEKEHEAERCPSCGGLPGHNPITGVKLKEGHRDNCKVMIDKRVKASRG